MAFTAEDALNSPQRRWLYIIMDSCLFTIMLGECVLLRYVYKHHIQSSKVGSRLTWDNRSLEVYHTKLGDTCMFVSSFVHTE